MLSKRRSATAKTYNLDTMLREYITDGSTTEWKRFRTGTRQDRDIGLMLGGIEDGPEAVDAIKPNNHSEPHFHMGAQFQVLVRGSIKFPRHTMQALTVHYTDHNVAYGPFDCSEDCEFLVLHAMPAGQISVTRETILQVNNSGRELIADAARVDWRPLAAGLREKLLLNEASGVQARLLEIAPNLPIRTAPAQYGCFEVVLAGSVLLNGKTITPYNLRFAKGVAAPAPSIAGPTGATVGLFTFDADASTNYGGNIPDFLARSH